MLVSAALVTAAIVGPRAAGDPFGIRQGGVSEGVTVVWKASASSVTSVCQLCSPFFLTVLSIG